MRREICLGWPSSWLIKRDVVGASCVKDSDGKIIMEEDIEVDGS